MSTQDYTLYNYFRSSCSARIRIALNLKQASYELIPVNLLKDEQLSDSHKSLNPSASVPLLICHDVKTKSKDGGPLKIGQSLAALEYLEEKHPEPALLPPVSDLAARSAVRVLMSIIASDIQPITNLRVTRRVQALGGNTEEWNLEIMTNGLRAYEAAVKDWAGKYSVGDNVTMADCCLLPAVWNAERVGVDVNQFETITKIAANLKELPAAKKASYYVQPDTPEELRQK